MIIALGWYHPDQVFSGYALQLSCLMICFSSENNYLKMNIPHMTARSKVIPVLFGYEPMIWAPKILSAAYVVFWSEVIKLL